MNPSESIGVHQWFHSPDILNESDTLSGKKPVYRLIDDSELLLTIYSARMVQPDED